MSAMANLLAAIADAAAEGDAETVEELVALAEDPDELERALGDDGGSPAK